MAVGIGSLALSLLLLANFSLTTAFPIEEREPRLVTRGRERISLNANWRFQRTEKNPDGLSYLTGSNSLRPYILPSANDFIKDPANRHKRPSGNPGGDVPFVQAGFDDSAWEAVTLPHDWAIKGPFYVGDNVPVSGGMGRLPSQGVGWYRRKLNVTAADKRKSIYLDIDGAQSYAMVWLNGQFVGGWPYGYARFRLNLTPFLKYDTENQLAIRLDNPLDSSRWYPGGGIYRNVWLEKVESVHVAQWGTYITTGNVTETSAKVNLAVQVENAGNSSRQVDMLTQVFVLDTASGQPGKQVAEFPYTSATIPAAGKLQINQSVVVQHPSLWGPWPSQTPHMYQAVTSLSSGNQTVDTYATNFGIRTFSYTGDNGLLVNGQRVRIQGVNQHQDLGALGSAFNLRAATRQLEILRELGVNAIRTSHNPPAPELLDLADRMGFLVFDEIFDTWQQQKTTNDFHLIFDDWHEPDLRAFIRCDRNHPSIFVWSVGNEVSEQGSGSSGAATARMLVDIAHEEDPTRPVTASMNSAKSNQPFPGAFDVLSLNYQGEGIRDTPAYSNTKGNVSPPQYPLFHSAFPQKLLMESESAAALSTRGTYILPVVDVISAPVNDTSGGNSTTLRVSDYDLYSADFGASPDKVFAAQDRNPYVAGEFVWSGFDYLGEPTPYYAARSSYFGIVDLAGFRKSRFYLYQSRWNPEVKSAHILPHWTWPGREGKVTPVHVFSPADEAELFVNGRSQGRKKKAQYEYRFRWDNVTYAPGSLHVVTYKAGSEWASATVNTAGPAAQLRVNTDRTGIAADGEDLSFVTVEVLDKDGNVVPEANNAITFKVEGAGELVATDNGDPADFTAFPSSTRKAFSGMALAIVRGKKGVAGDIQVSASAQGVEGGKVSVHTS